MQDIVAIKSIRRKCQSLLPELDERRRQWAAAEARDWGYGSVMAVPCATGLSRTTIRAGLAELDLPLPQRAAEGTRIRRPGAGPPAQDAADA